MGSAASQPDIDLLPPRFDRRLSTTAADGIATSPFYTRFGTAARHAVLNNFITPGSAIRVSAAMHPDYDEQSLVTADVSLQDGALQGGVLAFSACTPLSNARLAAHASVTTHASARLALSVDDAQRGVAAYALLPLEAPNAPPAAATGTAYMPLACGTGATHKPHNASGAQQRVEVGARFMGEHVTGGVHAASASGDVPLRVWGVAAAGDFELGLQVSTPSARALSRVRDTAALRDAVTVDAAVALRQPGLYELSLALDGDRRELVAGYVHSMTTRRGVYNPLAEEHVKGIYNYVDLAVELRRGAHAAAMALGASWQVNRNLLVKGRVTTRDVSVACAVKTWWDPAVTASLTASMDTATGRTGLGLALQVEKGGALQYTKGVRGYQTVAANRALTAQPQLSQRTSTTLDTNPLAPPPTARHAATAADGAGGRAAASRWM